MWHRRVGATGPVPASRQGWELSYGFPLKWVALMLICFDPSGLTLSDLQQRRDDGGWMGGTAPSPCAQDKRVKARSKLGRSD